MDLIRVLWASGPFDGVTPYRLEMQAKLALHGARDLYGFWEDNLARALAAETDCIVNLASKEYSRSVAPHLPLSVRLLTCVFGEEKAGKIAEKGTQCKMARGEMVRYLAENRVADPEALKGLSALGYRYSPKHSDGNTLVFCSQGKVGT